MMPNSNPIASRIGRLARSKTLIVACLLSSAAMLGEPQVAYARGGMNGFVAGALLGGAAMRGFGAPRGRVYRGGRTYQRSARRHHRERGTRSRDSAPEEKAPPGLGEANAGPGTPVSGAAAAGPTCSISPMPTWKGLPRYGCERCSIDRATTVQTGGHHLRWI